MNTLQLHTRAQGTIPRHLRIRSGRTHHPLLWISGALALAVIIFTVLLIAAKLLSGNAVALEAAPPSSPPDPFYQQKVDARIEELPAQF